MALTVCVLFIYLLVCLSLSTQQFILFFTFIYANVVLLLIIYLFFVLYQAAIGSSDARLQTIRPKFIPNKNPEGKPQLLNSS